MSIETRFTKPKTRRGTALRYAVLAGVGIALFSILFFRLWSLQVVTGDRYLAEANDNRIREVTVLAPRGRILDRDGKVLVDNRTSMALQLDPLEIPSGPRLRRQLFSSLGAVMGHDLRWVQRRYRREMKTSPPGSPVTLARDVGDSIVYYLQENQADFPEVQINRVFVRRYPQGTEAAHLLGSVGEVTAEDLEDPSNSDLEAGDTIGRAGVEQTYDDILRGRRGTTRIQVDSAGRVKGQLKSINPVPGKSIRLTIDSDVQQAGEAALSSIGLPGAFVTMNIDTGEVLGLASSPTFDPAIFTRPLTQSQVNGLYSEATGAPLFNRAISGAYPVGSVYKPITALAGLDSGVITPSTVVEDGGQIEIADQVFTNAGSQAHGSVDLQRALEVSSDVYFYKLGAEMNQTPQLQQWSRQFGIGELSGIDLPGGIGRTSADPGLAQRAVRKR